MGWGNRWEDSGDVYNLEVCTKKRKKSLLLCPPVTVIAVDAKGWRSQANNIAVICFKLVLSLYANHKHIPRAELGALLSSL